MLRPEPLASEDPKANPVDALAQDLVGLLAPYLKKKRFKAGTYLWHGGDPARRCIVIDRGRIMASRQLPSGRSVPTCLRGPGEIVGFPPLFDGSGYPTTVKALEDLEVRVLERSDLLRAVQDGPVALLMFKLFANRLREVFKVVDQLSQRSAIPRVAAALLALVQDRPAKDGFTFVTLPLAAGTLAKALGIAPETLSRAIGQMIAEGVLHRLSVRKYQVLDLDRLRTQAQEDEPA
ncbi:Crp/Fnr family transcriptional regulator [Mesoterricola silvestris]|uniref:Crp/Fnr family transcriptional regulator n=2 Tax=Mesoterricola silvestris TaxID=2927979 RepID=A0AA48GI94_9BACT|nr:Crp/Fnr family transcriptional regulator [Mesoterricola silvestris]